MSTLCAALHDLARRGTRQRFPFDRARLQLNGIYALFESGEHSHGGERIVRVGTHTGERQLPSRLTQHFVNENKDRSIFRKNIGRALLNRAGDPFLADWEIDRTTRAARQAVFVDLTKLQAVEAAVTRELQARFTFVVFRCDDKDSRLALESKTISTLSLCEECQPSEGWLGRYSPKARIRESGLWLVNELYKAPLAQQDLESIRTSLQ